jgi:ribonucleoside-diphosphate reductase alpha chain
MIGPQTAFSQHLHSVKYRTDGESFDDYCVRYARTLADDEHHFRHLLGALREQRILPGGRQQLAIGRPFQTTAFSCYVGGVIPDSMAGIMDELKDSALTLRAGGGCGWNFSTLRPELDPIRGLGPGARASGPVGFMPLWHTMCATIMSAGMRRGAMMGVLDVRTGMSGHTQVHSRQADARRPDELQRERQLHGRFHGGGRARRTV